MEEIVSMPFKKADRSYFSTPSGWRLATFEETRDGLRDIKEHNILERWDRVRLLDGWILGPGYGFQMGNDFRGCLGYMLLIQIQTHLSGCAYANVSISDKQKEVALLLSADDCNYEVVYWLINSWAKTDSMDLQDVIQGRLPFTSYSTTFNEMNVKVGSLARKLGDHIGPVSAKADKRRFSGLDSVQAVLSDMIQIVNEEKLEQYDIAKFYTIRGWIKSCFPSWLEPAWLQEPAAIGDDEWSSIADAFWNFLSECFAGTMVEILATLTIADICHQLNDVCDLETITSSEKNFIVASHILIWLSEYRTDIIHAPLAHDCTNSCVGKIICYVASNNEPVDRARFKQTLETNAMWKCYDNIGSYDLLNKLLVVAASCKVPRWLEGKGKSHLFLVNKLLECGAQLGSAYAILRRKKVTALLAAILCIEDEDTEIEVATSLLNKYDVRKQKEMVNTPTEDGWNLLHIASLRGEAKTCQMLLDYGAEPGSLRREDSKTAFHIAVEGGIDAVINVFLKHPNIIDFLDLRDMNGESPLETAVANSDIKLAAKLIAKSKQHEVYFDKVDIKQLLRYSILDGSVHIVEKLLEKGTKLPAGECNDEGKTILHLAAMCEDDDNAMEMVEMAVLKSNQGKEKLVANCDKRGRTALQEAALNGNIELCDFFLNINRKIMSLKDKNGQNPIYDAIKAKKNEVEIIEMLLAAYSMKDTPLNALTDRNGFTSLHIAASLGKKDVVKLLLSSQNNSKQYLKRSDFLGQTALHKAVNNGDYETVKLLLDEGAHPLTERDCDGRTALHYAVQSKTDGDKIKLADCLLKGCKTDEERLLLLWASAASLGTADDLLRNNNDDPLCKFLVEKKKLGSGNLLKMAASVGDIEMTKELITRGYQMGDIHDTEWSQRLPPQKQENVDKVSRQLERIVDQANDQPTVVDNLGRIDYAKGLAALLLNPYIKPPIVVGISGSWGMGKSSLMVQTESILLKTAAQMTLLPSTILSNSASELPEITVLELSRKGREKYEAIQKHVDFDNKVNRTLFSAIIDKISRSVDKNDNMKPQEQIGHTEKDSVRKFLYSYEPKYRKIFKSLAAMDASDMFKVRTRENQAYQNPHSKSTWQKARDRFTTNTQRSKSVPQQSAINSPIEQTVPAILTVQYNAWKYRNETEALAGMAVEITKELEGIMTEAQWLSSCWRNTWKKRKCHIWIEIIFPCLLAVILACTITWLLWIILDKSHKLRNWVIPKYACLPTAIVVIGWTVTRSAMSILKPVSSQLMSYISFPDHTDKLGYQERVISDINFLKYEIGRKPCMIFKAYSWICTMISTLWYLFFDWWVTPLFFNCRILGKAMLSPKIAPAAAANLRIIVFIDDLDRCQESVILQVLSAINLVLAVCEINVVLGIDKGLIERAIIKKYGDMKNSKSFKDNQELADRYLQKIIQLPLDLPDPSEEQSRKFLEGQLGVFQEPSESSNPEVKPNTGMNKTIRQETLMPEARRSTETVPEIIPEVAIDVHSRTPVTNDGCTRQILLFFKQIFKLFITFPSICCGKKDETEGTASNAAAAQTRQNYWSQIPIRELLFVRYSKGEQDAFCYFQQLATDSRKLPREWKRHLTYHRLVWNIFYLTGEAKDLAGWQVQLITWIFICWEWRENMNIVIQNWNKIGIIETSSFDGPSLQRIVDHFIEVEMGTSHQEETKETILKVSDSRDVNDETESSKRKQKKLDEAVEDEIMMQDAGRPLFQEKNKKKNKRKKKKKMEEEMREKSLKGNIDDQQRNKRTGQEKLDSAVIKQIGKLEKMLDELKKEINDLKDEALKKHSRKNEKREEEKKMKIKRWETLRSALGIYDVPMNAIQAFQRFRFYCIAGHLSWPLSEQVQRKKNNDSYED